MIFSEVDRKENRGGTRCSGNFEVMFLGRKGGGGKVKPIFLTWMASSVNIFLTGRDGFSKGGILLYFFVRNGQAKS